MDNIENTKKKINIKKKSIYLFLILFILVIMIVGVTYAWFGWQSSTRSNLTITAGEITVTYNGGNNITGIKLIPVSSKEKGVTDGTAVYKEITASSTEPTYMDLNMTLQTFPTALKHKYLLWELYNGNTKIGEGNLGDNVQGDVVNLVTSEPLTTTTSTFKLYIWIDGNQPNPTAMMNQNFTFVLNATATDDPSRLTVAFDYNGGVKENNNLFKFDGTTQTINGTTNNTTWGNNYLQFNGTNSYVNLGQINSNYMTMEATFSADEYMNTTQAIIDNIETGGGGIFLMPSNHSTYPNKILGEFYIDGSYRIICSNESYQPNEQYHVVLSYDGTKIKLFVNGNLESKLEIDGIIKPPNYSTVMMLGGNPYSNGLDSNQYKNTFKGKIYSASVYSMDKDTKTVKYGRTYGSLPTPTREGYTFMGWSELSEDYQQVEYLKSTGAQYINTNLSIALDLKLDLDFKANNNTSGKYIMGKYQSNDGSFYLYFGGGYFQTAYGSTYANTTKQSDIDRHYWEFYIENDNSIAKCDNNVVFTRSVLATMPNSNILIGGTYHSGSAVSSNTYGAKFYRNNSLIRDFIPAYRKSDSVRGLYDLVNNVFYTNAGTGTFNIGSDVNDLVTSSTIVAHDKDHTLTAIWEAN